MNIDLPLNCDCWRNRICLALQDGLFWQMISEHPSTRVHEGAQAKQAGTSMITRVAFVVILCLFKHSSLRNVLIKHFGYMCLLGGGFSPYLGKVPILAKNCFNGVVRPPTSLGFGIPPQKMPEHFNHDQPFSITPPAGGRDGF